MWCKSLTLEKYISFRMKWFFSPPFLSVSPFLLLNLVRRQCYAYAVGLYTRPEIKSWSDVKFCAHAHCVLPRCSIMMANDGLTWSTTPAGSAPGPCCSGKRQDKAIEKKICKSKNFKQYKETKKTAITKKKNKRKEKEKKEKKRREISSAGIRTWDLRHAGPYLYH